MLKNGMRRRGVFVLGALWLFITDAKKKKKKKKNERDLGRVEREEGGEEFFVSSTSALPRPNCSTVLKLTLSLSYCAICCADEEIKS